MACPVGGAEAGVHSWRWPVAGVHRARFGADRLNLMNASYDERAHVDSIVSRHGAVNLCGVRFWLGAGRVMHLPRSPLRSILPPPCLLLVGGGEVLRADSSNLAVKLEGEGVQVDFREWRTCCMWGHCLRVPA